MIILHGNNEEFLNIGLNEILLQIDAVNEYEWKLLWINGVSYQLESLDGIEMNMLELESVVNNSQEGFLISPNTLLKMSTLFDDLIEIIIIGDRDILQVKKSDDYTMKLNCEYFIELVDSSYWEISSKNNVFINRIKLKYTNYIEV